MRMKVPSKQSFIVILIASIVINLAMPMDSHAADKADKSAKRNAILMQQMKQEMQTQFDQEKVAMQTAFDQQKASLEYTIKSQEQKLQKLSSAEGKVKSLESEQRKVSAEKTTLDAKQQQTQMQLEATSKTLEDLKLELKQAQIDLKTNDNQRKMQLTNLSQTTKSLTTCEEKNAKLHQFGTNLIAMYEKPEKAEPIKNNHQFFKLKSVELENILQNKQDEIDAERLQTKN